MNKKNLSIPENYLHTNAEANVKDWFRSTGIVDLEEFENAADTKLY